jgi:hypothetical protein
VHAQAQQYADFTLHAFYGQVRTMIHQKIQLPAVADGVRNHAERSGTAHAIAQSGFRLHQVAQPGAGVAFKAQQDVKSQGDGIHGNRGGNTLPSE